MKLTHSYSGKSLLELKAQFGTGNGGFYPQAWYDNEPFAKEHAPKGKYEIILHDELKNLTYADQVKKIPKGYNVVHPAILAEAILTHYERTKKYLLPDWYARTSALTSDGNRVSVGYFDSGGLLVSNDWYDYRSGLVAVASSRKSKKNIDTGTLDPIVPLSFDGAEITVGKDKYRLTKI